MVLDNTNNSNIVILICLCVHLHSKNVNIKVSSLALWLELQIGNNNYQVCSIYSMWRNFRYYCHEMFQDGDNVLEISG